MNVGSWGKERDGIQEKIEQTGPSPSLFCRPVMWRFFPCFSNSRLFQDQSKRSGTCDYDAFPKSNLLPRLSGWCCIYWLISIHPFPLCPKRLISLMTLIIITVNEDQVQIDYSPDATRPELVSAFSQTSTKARRSNKEWKAPIDSHVKRALKTSLGFTVHEWSSCNFFIAF